MERPLRGRHRKLPRLLFGHRKRLTRTWPRWHKISGYLVQLRGTGKVLLPGRSGAPGYAAVAPVF